MIERGEKMQERHVVTVFLRFAGKVLIVKRSRAVGSFQGCWSAISGYLEAGVTPREQACTEVLEETGLGARDLVFAREAPLYPIRDATHSVVWVVHPFLFEVLHPERISLDWENDALRWVTPEQLAEYETVPGLLAVLKSVLKP